ncbi:MAG: TonB-dependent siderophore receptor [Leptolyngbyaceae cyanobacterium SM1_3_5]|nr:TonB-dependent siderophore receptor [Leptolyngbyaceae cyanobacterium SM1_3_5]
MERSQFFGIGLAGVALAVVQPVQAQSLQTVDVQIVAGDRNLTIQLQGSIEPLTPLPATTDGNTLLIEIPNAQLRSPQTQENPTADIAAVEITQSDRGSILVRVVGAAAVPIATTAPTPQGLQIEIAAAPLAEPPPALSTPPTSSTTAIDLLAPAENAIRIIATGDRTSYRIGESSVGTRTDTDILNVPQSIQVIPEQVIEEQGARSLGETARNTAGVTTGRISSGSLATEFVIRGFATENILRNGLRDTTQQFATGITNVDRLEILRGPASVLFGQGSLGGTVNIVTEIPLDEPTYELEYLIGQDDLHRGSIDFSSPFSPDSDLGFRLNMAYESSGSFREFEESNFLFIAPTVTLINTADTTLIADLEYLNVRSSGTASELPALGTVVDSPFGSIDRTTNLGEPSLSESRSNLTRLGYRIDHRLSDDWRIRNEFLAAFSDVGENTGVIPVSVLADGRSLRRVLTRNPSTNTSITFNTNVVGQFSTGSIDHELLFGVELFSDSLRDQIDIINVATIDLFDPEYSGVAGNLLERQDTRTSRNAIGFYLQDQISLSDELILVLGGRFDVANLNFENLLRETDSFESQATAFSPRVGLVFKPEENLSFYASFTRSFEPVAGREQLFDPVTNTTAFGQPFEPERGVQYEIGVKADFDDRLSATLALYQLDRSNVTTTGAESAFTTVQVGEQRSRGVELSVTGELTDGWNLIASYAYTDAQITADNTFEVGNRLPNTPEHAASLWTTYEIQSGDLEGLGFGIGLFFQGERQGNLTNTFTLPGFLRTDATVFYRRDRFRASVNLQNLFDVEYYEGSRDNTDARVVVGAPFTISGQIAWEF